MSVEMVTGSALNSPSTFQISCSSFRLGTTDPAHKNSMAFKNVCVHTRQSA